VLVYWESATCLQPAGGSLCLRVRYVVLLFWFSSSETFVGFLFIVCCLLFSFEQLCGFIAFLTVLLCGFLSDNSKTYSWRVGCTCTK
jgi:hypothetical protein